MKEKNPLPGRVRALEIARRTLRSERGITLAVTLMVMVIMLVIIGAGLVFSGLDLRITGNYRAGTHAFYAADAGINVGLSQLTVNHTLASAPFSGTIAGGYAFRSGPRTATTPQPLQFRGMRTETGYSIGSGTGYNPSGYVFYTYQINVTGNGPLGAAREVEAQAEYGPVAR